LQLADVDGTTTLLQLYEQHLAPPPKKEKKSKKAKEEKAKEEEDAPKRKKLGQDEEEEAEGKKKAKKAKKRGGEEEEEEEKKEDANPQGKKGAKAKAGEKQAEGDSSAEDGKPKKDGKKEKGGNVPFQRIKSDEVQYLKVKGGKAEAERLLDNTFESKFADGNIREDYGAKASAILVAVRGKDFRHEKTKKKRGTYKGGPIDLASNSIKFVNSSDEDEE
jgi:hypothetical protein